MTTILVGVDDSERSEDAVAFAALLARASGAAVLVASAFPYDDYPSRAANLEYRRLLEHDAKTVARRMADRLGDLGEGRVQVVSIPRTSPAHGLTDLALERHAALIVVGSTHVGTTGRVFPGSTGERLLHGAPCPVAVVPRGYREGEHRLRRIGVAWDGSPEADAALAGAADLARATAAELAILRAVDVLAYGTPAMMGGPSYASVREELERGARRALDEATARTPEAVTAEGVLLIGDPRHEIAARTGELDLLVTGSRGYGPLRAVVVGALTGRLLREAACPVIVVPRGVETPLGELFAAEAEARA